ncbi:4676_t:CDS:2 [Acaulospora colombiana]|uniref:4676_t:CDS:1 n=1 Tax=Acaulospora colombiana TaxID=27376 RepID=A0ACA9NK56_9GLOM|nr:4676_t:CDS:2 [Acaulospora colombiana]
MALDLANRASQDFQILMTPNHFGLSSQLLDPNAQEGENYGKFLHSHHHKSPLSNQQEVSAFDGLDTGDNWKLICVDTSAKYWLREQKIKLLHVDTSLYLSSNKEMVYNNPINGQIEVAASSRNDKNTEWIAQEGMYFADKNTKSS